MKIYIAQDISYEIWYDFQVFSTKEKAEEYISKQKYSECYDLMIHTVDKLNSEEDG